jgi:hypothetical protein
MSDGLWRGCGFCNRNNIVAFAKKLSPTSFVGHLSLGKRKE